jgi:hypothetical protein
VIIDARQKVWGVLWDLDAHREILNAQWADTDTGEYVVIATDAAGRRLYEALFEDLRTGRREWVTIGPDPRPDAADRAAPAKGLLRVSRVRAVRVRKRGRITFIAEPRG